MLKGLWGSKEEGKGFNNSVNPSIVNEGTVVEPEVVDADFVATIASKTEQMPYTGQVVSSGDGFSFLDHVKRGYETVNTGGDVFVPQTFQVGVFVEFDTLSPDPKRDGKFRTESARIINRALVTAGGQRMALDLYQRLTQRQIYHVNAKRIDPAEAEKAAENAPFIDVLGAKINMGEADVKDMAENFLKGLFANISSIGVSYSIAGDVDINQESSSVDEARQLAKGMGMDGQAESIDQEYAKFMGIRKAFTLMHQNGLLSLESVVPLRNLPDLLVACPVWFISGKTCPWDQMDDGNPDFAPALRYFCDAVGTEAFSSLYQIYNRRVRGFQRFSGRDIIPVPIAKLIKEASQTFDYLVIATPYHDIASKEWATPWPRIVDPFLFGFMEGIDYMFLLGRWSGTGLFPLVCDMIADTMDHLRVNKGSLSKIPGRIGWYKPGIGWQNLSDSSDETNNVLEHFADDVLKAYEERRLFAFLRGEDSGATH